jgi:hypothetical protein
VRFVVVKVVKWKDFVLLAISVFVTVLSFSILVFRMFYPYHREIAIVLYVLSWLFCMFPFLRKISLQRIKHHPEYKLLKRNIFAIIGFFIFIIILYCLFVLFPLDNLSFTPSETELFDEKVEDDLVYLEQVIASLDHSFEALENSGLLELSIDSSTPSQVDDLKDHFSLILDQLVILEGISHEYKYFYQINGLAHPEEYNNAFILAYTSYLAKYKLVYDLSAAIQTEYVETLLNEEIYLFGENQYLVLRTKYSDPATSLRINTGRIYVEQMSTVPEEAQFLVDYSKSTYDELFHGVDLTIQMGFGTLLDIFEKNTMDSWLPMQKEIANTISQVRLTLRHENFITLEQLEEVRLMLEPGDILFQRRNWYASNPGMPGFWTHVVLYTGTMDEMNTYFTEDAESLLGMSLSDYLALYAPDYYLDMQELDKNNLPYVTLEGKAEGIVILSLVDSAKADYLGVIRPSLSKKDKLQALLYAIDNYKKPYDYNFDFSTDDSFVCSELVYKAYSPTEEKNGLSYDLDYLAGRPLLAPNDMVQTFSENYLTENQQNVFILFLDGNEDERAAEWSDVDEFLLSWERPKYDLLLE